MTKTTKSTDFNADLVRQLADLLEEKSLTEIEFGQGDWRVRVAKQGIPVTAAVAAAPVAAAPAPAAAPAAVAAAAEPATEDLSKHPGVVVSPMVGVVYTSPEPGAPAFCKVGDTVNEGDTVMLVEAMKVFNPIKAQRTGKVSRVFVSNSDPVEFGEPLLIIE